MNSQLKLQLTQKIQLEDSSLFFIALRVMSLLYALKRGKMILSLKSIFDIM